MSHKIEIGTAPAFPIQDCSKWQWHGLTERDFFAAMAMIGLLANEGRDGASYVGDRRVAIAREAVAQSDALLAELEKTKEGV